MNKPFASLVFNLGLETVKSLYFFALSLIFYGCSWGQLYRKEEMKEWEVLQCWTRSIYNHNSTQNSLLILRQVYWYLFPPLGLVVYQLALPSALSTLLHSACVPASFCFCLFIYIYVYMYGIPFLFHMQMCCIYGRAC